MTATTIDITHSSAAAKALRTNIIPGVILALIIGAILGLLSFMLGLGNIISGMLGALGALALVWFGARCISGGIKNAAREKMDAPADRDATSPEHIDHDMSRHDATSNV
ncbi:MAG: SoxR reducing system RseC family protein [Phycisphaerales bacterium]|nr:SoxR reducing system RseC family protein [Phycisphaerales bacterium]